MRSAHGREPTDFRPAELLLPWQRRMFECMARRPFLDVEALPAWRVTPGGLAEAYAEGSILASVLPAPYSPLVIVDAAGRPLLLWARPR